MQTLQNVCNMKKHSLNVEVKVGELLSCNFIYLFTYKFFLRGSLVDMKSLHL